MKTNLRTFLTVISLIACHAMLAQKSGQLDKLNNAIDNQGYWRAAAEAGLTRPNPMRSVPSSVFTGSEIRAVSVLTEDSPDVVLITGSTSQSENSVFVNPNDNNNALNSNNSTNQPSGGITLYGADYLYSFDGGVNWGGSMQGVGGSNQGDPATAIGSNGRYYINFINNGLGQGMAYSDNNGSTWLGVTVASGGGNTLDKNHMWIDNSPTSPYEGNLYVAWTPFGGSNDQEVVLSRSADDGLTWSAATKISGGANAGYLCQGVNIQTGPNGEVYAAFCIYDNWPSDEDAIGFARSLDGGLTWTSFRAIDNIRGIRSTGTGKNMRVNAFPVMACDISTGPNRGDLYITWTNVGVPGINSGSDVDVYMIRSENNGDTWSAPVRVNQDPAGMGKKHYFGWITCDPATGALSMIFYDDRNVSASQLEVFCANSFDGGQTWEDFKVSDVAFTPSPIPGLASQYFGDYLGISARSGKVYPVWTDNRTGTALTYTSPYQTSTMVAPTALVAQLNQETGQVNLTWTHQAGPTFSHYNVYRGLSLLGTTSFPFYIDMLPAYGSYSFRVTAVYTIEGESAPAVADVQWGNAQAATNPEAIEVFVLPGESTSFIMELTNSGEMPLNYTSSFSVAENGRDGSRAYCTGIGSCGEGIAGVTFGTVSNFSDCGGYQDFSNLSHLAAKGESFQITVNNITNLYPEDVCGIWIDWNQNESLTDDAPISVSGSPGPGPYTATITVPENAKNGDARMRIRIGRGGTLSPCGSVPNGEVEDYSVKVLGWVTASPAQGAVQPGAMQPITFSFDAAGMGIGTYQANYTIYSNDPDDPQIVIPVTMNVANASVNIVTNKDSLCLGNSTVLNASVVGGSGTFTYSWTSDPPGFVSDEASVLVWPTVTTTYYVEVNDGSIIMSDAILITVLPLPVVDLGDDIAICSGETAILDAGPGFSHYFWATGQTGQTITVSEAGGYWVEVTNQYGCSDRDTIYLEINPLPAVNLGADNVLCDGSSVMLSAGTGFVSYIWNTGDNSYYINVTDPGEYWVEVTDNNGCVNSDTILLTGAPAPDVSLGNDQNFCQGTAIPLDAGSGFASYLWSTGETAATISASEGGEYWVEVTDANGCSARDTVFLTMDPLPVLTMITSGPVSVDNFLGIPSDFIAWPSTFANDYEWRLEPAEAGSITGSGLSVQVTWSPGFTGNANVTVRGVNDCGAGPYSGNYIVAVYSSQAIGEKNAVTGVRLYPNPNDGAFVLHFNSTKDHELRFIISTTGGNQVYDIKEKIQAGPYRKNFNLGNLPAGTYSLVITNADGKMLSREQIIMQ
jgi:hypothetical protein